MLGLLLTLAIIAVIVVVATRLLGGAKSAAPIKPDARGQNSTTLPERLAVKTKAYFFSRSENAFFTALTSALEGTPYQVFPKVRLNDVFDITAKGQGEYARLRDKHVDFLLVTRQDYRPVFAIELDGPSHDNEVQRRRDATKNLAFRSANLPLLRLDARRMYSSATLRDILETQLPSAHPVSA